MRLGSLQGAVRRVLQPPFGVAAFAAVHFTFVVLGALTISVESSPMGPLRAIVPLYVNAAGLDGSYRFFSPDIGDQTIAFVDTTSASRERRHLMVGNVAGEADLRFVNFMSFMVLMDKRHLLARVLAVRTFAQDSHATHASVVIGSYRMPTMREYRAGRRPFLERDFSTQFDKRSRAKS